MCDTLRLRVVSLALAALLLWAGSSKALAEPEIREPRSRVAFPLHRSWGSSRLRCIGTALRRKFGFKVAAFCFYVDEKRARERLRAFLGAGRAGGAYQRGVLDVEQLLFQPGFFSWLIDQDIPMAVDMTFIIGVGGGTLRKYSREELAVLLKDEDVMSRYLSQFQGDIQKYQHMTLFFPTKEQVILQVAGRTHPVIRSRALRWSLLSLYLGENASAKGIKRDLLRQVDTLLTE